MDRDEIITILKGMYKIDDEEEILHCVERFFGENITVPPARIKNPDRELELLTAYLARFR